MSKIDKYTFSNDENDYSKLNSGRTSRQGEFGRVRENINSLDDASVRNSHSGATDGGNVPANGVTNGVSSAYRLNQGSVEALGRNQRETLHSRFDFIKVLGKGTYGKVKLANDKRTGKQVINHFFLIILI